MKTESDNNDKMNLDELLKKSALNKHHKYFLKSALPHIIGSRGWVIQKLESFCWTLIFISECEVFVRLGFQGKVIITRPRKACLLAKFPIEMIAISHYSMFLSLIQNGF